MCDEFMKGKSKHLLHSCSTRIPMYRQMAERSVQEFRSEIAIGLEDIQPAAQEGDKTLSMYLCMHLYHSTQHTCLCIC